AIRCPAPAGDTRPTRTAPDPSASPYGSRPAAWTRTDRAAARATAAAPASTPLPRPAQLQFRQLDADDRGVRQQPFTAVLRKQRQRARLRGAVLDHRDRPPPRQFLRVVDLAQVQHVPLHHSPAADPRVLDNAPVAVLLAILPANLAAQEHDGRQLSAHWRP